MSVFNVLVVLEDKQYVLGIVKWMIAMSEVIYIIARNNVCRIT